MRPERRYVLRDLFIGGGSVFVFARFLVPTVDGEWWLLVPMSLAAVLWAGFLYVAERDAFPERIDALGDNPFAVGILAFAAFAVLVPPVLLWPAVVPPYLAAAFGMGLGHLGNRLVFGVLRPLPRPVAQRVSDSRW